ncbi:hypothetical protein PCANB_002246 [Pneumocystis canis]|nr:hypothetical protein PCANB_002246 [Pneumocystis canis]
MIFIRNIHFLDKITYIPFRISRFHTRKCFRESFIKEKFGLAPPQVIIGSVNDPTPTPIPSPVHGSYHWTFERLVSVSLVPLVMAPFVGSSTNPILDAILSLALVVHSHIGFDTCITDYFPKREYKFLSGFMKWTLRGMTSLVLFGLYEFETNDVGITEGIKRVWKA